MQYSGLSSLQSAWKPISEHSRGTFIIFTAKNSCTPRKKGLVPALSSSQKEIAMVFNILLATTLLVCVVLSSVWQAYFIYYLLSYLWTRQRKAVAGKLPARKAISEELDCVEQDTTANKCEATTVPLQATVPETTEGLETNADYPMVTIQATAYNEVGCIEGLLQNLSKIQWPSDRLQIQLLNDSTLPEAIDLADKVILDLKEQGIDIEHCQRPNRIGYKAGNLLHHFPSIRGDYVAIFDADFLPKPDFLLKTIPHFYDAHGTKVEDVGLVQTTWDHFNQTDNLLTLVQGTIQNFHFIVQQNVRYRCFGFIPFNGTAGVWKREAIEKSGNWNYDTVTEDLDIACRANLRGYRFVYLEDVTVPSELPPTMMAYKRQQRRWTQGHMQVSRKILRAVWKSPFTLRQHIDITYILLYKLDWLFGLIGTLTFPLLGLAELPRIFIICLIVPGVSYMVFWSIALVVSLYDKKFMNPDMSFGERMKRLYVLPFFFILNTGMSFWHFVAVIEGLIQNDIPFATTPKIGNKLNMDEEKLQHFADQDDLDGATDENEGENIELHLEGWNDSALEGTRKFVKRRKPGWLSKSFPQWAHFVEFFLGCYLLLLPALFYENIVYGIPVIIISTGFFWVSIAAIKMSVTKWWSKKPNTEDEDKVEVTSITNEDLSF